MQKSFAGLSSVYNYFISLSDVVTWKTKDEFFSAKLLNDFFYFTRNYGAYVTYTVRGALHVQNHTEFLLEYERRVGNTTALTGHQEAPYGYDSVWTIALMLNNSIQRMNEEGWTSLFTHASNLRSLAAPIVLNSSDVQYNTVPVSYTHLTLPTKRIV